MTQGWVDRCIFQAVSAGNGSFVVSSAVTGFITPTTANAVDGYTYHYSAQLPDLSEWEVGTGVWSAGTQTLTRATIEFNSDNTTLAHNFTAAPQVMITLLATDLSAFSTLFINVNAPPYNADPTGNLDSTPAFNAAIAFAAQVGAGSFDNHGPEIYAIGTYFLGENLTDPGITASIVIKLWGEIHMGAPLILQNGHIAIVGLGGSINGQFGIPPTAGIFGATNGIAAVTVTGGSRSVLKNLIIRSGAAAQACLLLDGSGQAPAPAGPFSGSLGYFENLTLEPFTTHGSLPCIIIQNWFWAWFRQCRLLGGGLSNYTVHITNLGPVNATAAWSGGVFTITTSPAVSNVVIGDTFYAAITGTLFNLSSITWSSAGGGTATATTSSPHGVPIGNTFRATITGASPGGYNNNNIPATATGTSTFTYSIPSNPGINTTPGQYGYYAIYLATLTGTNTFTYSDVTPGSTILASINQSQPPFQSGQFSSIIYFDDLIFAHGGILIDSQTTPPGLFNGGIYFRECSSESLVAPAWTLDGGNIAAYDGLTVDGYVEADSVGGGGLLLQNGFFNNIRLLGTNDLKKSITLSNAIMNSTGWLDGQDALTAGQAIFAPRNTLGNAGDFINGAPMVLEDSQSPAATPFVPLVLNQAGQDTAGWDAAAASQGAGITVNYGLTAPDGTPTAASIVASSGASVSLVLDSRSITPVVGDAVIFGAYVRIVSPGSSGNTTVADVMQQAFLNVLWDGIGSTNVKWDRGSGGKSFGASSGCIAGDLGNTMQNWAQNSWLPYVGVAFVASTNGGSHTLSFNARCNSLTATAAYWQPFLYYIPNGSLNSDELIRLWYSLRRGPVAATVAGDVAMHVHQKLLLGGGARLDSRATQPVKYLYSVGDRTFDSTGTTPGWECTATGGTFSTTRANSTAYATGVWAAWPTGTTVVECTVSGTTAGSAPSAPTSVGQVVTDGGVHWTCRSLTHAVFALAGRAVLTTSTTFYVSILSGTLVSGSGYVWGEYGTAASPVSFTGGSGSGANGIFMVAATTNTLTGGSGYVDATYFNVALTGGTGSGALATIIVSGGIVTTVYLTTIGTGYLVNDNLTTSNANLGGSGSGFNYKITAIGVAHVLPVTQGTGYKVTDVLSASNAGLGGSGSGFTFTLTAIGSDSNNGLTSTTPFLTLQHFDNVLSANYDIGSGSLTHTLSVADGLFPGSRLAGAYLGAATINYQGNQNYPRSTRIGECPTSHGACLIGSGAGATFYDFNFTGPFTADNFTGMLDCSNVSYGNGNLGHQTIITVNQVANIGFGANTIRTVLCFTSGNVSFLDNFLIDGGKALVFAQISAPHTANHYAAVTTFINTPFFTSGTFGVTAALSLWDLTQDGIPTFSGSINASSGRPYVVSGPGTAMQTANTFGNIPGGSGVAGEVSGGGLLS